MPSMSAIGYRQLVDYDDGRESWESIREEILDREPSIDRCSEQLVQGTRRTDFVVRHHLVNFECAAFGAVAEWLRNRGKTSGYG